MCLRSANQRPNKGDDPSSAGIEMLSLMVTLFSDSDQRQVLGWYVDFSPNLPQVRYGEHGGSVFL